MATRVTPQPLTTQELVAARDLLNMVNGLQHAIHQLEYLTRIPDLIAEQDRLLLAAQSDVQEQQNRLQTIRQTLMDTQIRLAERQAEVDGAEKQLAELQGQVARQTTQLNSMREAREMLRDELREELRA